MSARGFSLVETLIALVLTMVVTGTAIGLATPAMRGASVQPEVIDVQQRARVAAETIARDLASAGAGMYVGASAGVLPTTIPAVLPRRLSSVSGDGATVARSTAITLLSVPSSSSQTTIATAISAASLSLVVNPAPNCGAAVLCGLQVGQDVLVADGAGHFDVFRITKIVGGTGTLRHHGQTVAGTYLAGAFVTQVVSRTYEFDEVAHQLRQYDGDQSDQPSVDHLSTVAFSYWGAEAGTSRLVALPLSSFVDGPWLGAGTTSFDADLLRVRVIRITVGAESADVNLRARVPPFVSVIDVSPRSLSVGR